MKYIYIIAMIVAGMAAQAQILPEFEFKSDEEQKYLIDVSIDGDVMEIGDTLAIGIKDTKVELSIVLDETWSMMDETYLMWIDEEDAKLIMANGLDYLYAEERYYDFYDEKSKSLAKAARKGWK
jgi:hypothetical protein